MRPALTALWLAFLFSIPLWIGDLYVLHVLIITGIFIIAAMSLNLLLGYTGQLSLGHVAFFGIGAYASALMALGFSVTSLSTASTSPSTRPSRRIEPPSWTMEPARASSRGTTVAPVSTAVAVPASDRSTI